MAQTDSLGLLLPLTLAALVLLAAAIDWRSHRLPNWLTLGGAALGLVLSFTPAGPGIVQALLGALAALVLLFPLWLLRVTGAGDVKLLVAVGTFLGWPHILFAILFSMVAGGVFALAFALRQRSLARMVLNARDLIQLSAMAAVLRQQPQLGGFASVGRLPYGVCVCAGTLTWLALVHWRG